MEKIKMYVEVRRTIEVETEVNDNLANNLALGKAKVNALTVLCDGAIQYEMQKQSLKGAYKVIDYDFIGG